MSSKKTAIKALKAHKEALTTVRTENDGYVWTSHATDLVKKYIGKGNQLYSSTFHFSFDSSYYFESGQARAAKLIDSCIQFIETNGVYKESGGNFISRMPEGWAIFWAGALVTFFGMGGFFIGDYTARNKIDTSKIALEDTVRRLKAEKSLLIIQLSTNPPKQKATDTKSPDNKRQHK